MTTRTAETSPRTYARIVGVIVLSVPGELAFTVWLLWKGVGVEKWEERASASA